MIDSSTTIPVSVVIPAFNAAAFLEETLATVEAQTARPAEVIVVDDGSTDATGVLARRLGARVITLERNSGPGAARNAGVRAATQPWIAFLDADDSWNPVKLAKQWAALALWPEAGFCFTDYDVIEPDGTRTRSAGTAHTGYRIISPAERKGAAARIAPDDAIRGLVQSMFLRQSSVVIRREMFLRSGGYDETMRLAEDYELFLRVSAPAPVVSVERSLVVYRRRTQSLSADPLAEVRSIDALWERILTQPQRYPASTLACVKRQRIPTLHDGVARALRLGRFSDARSLSVRALRLETSAASLAWWILTALVDNAAGARLHRALRARWRARAKRAAST